ncbi:MAG TPA: response regulator [Opitutaceae bacterium]|nr:response regulator [Opitutaceae bacterium]
MATLLLIEDNVPLAQVMTHALQRAGYDVMSATTGRAGTDLLKVRAVDLVITDIVMPEQDGIETVMWIREHQPHVRVIAISGDSPQHARLYLTMTQKFGVVRTLLKPFRAEVLLGVVEEVLRERTPPSQERTGPAG